MMKKPENINYCAIVAKIKTLIPIENCDNVIHSNLFGNLVIVSKDVKVDDIGLFFPVETKLSKAFLSNNNLYRDSELNIDKTKKGYFEINGRIRAVKFRGNKSMGFYIPLSSIDFINYKDLKIGDEFDELKGVKICEKYIVKRGQPNLYKKGKQASKKFKSKLLDNQFRFHIDTSQLGKFISKIREENLIQITSKFHGTSLISSNILCKRKLNIFEKIMKFVGIKIQDTEYDNVFSSRKVIKNENINPNKKDYYAVDIWALANKKLQEHLEKGMTIFAEIVGYLPNGSYIQKNYDYNCQDNEFEIRIYRITNTNVDGKVFEYSARQVKYWCIARGLKSVIEIYYGYAGDLFNKLKGKHKKSAFSFERDFLELLQIEYLEKDSIYCQNTVPEEGIVLRVETNDIEVYKLKSDRFYEYETKELDSGVENIEG